MTKYKLLKDFPGFAAGSTYIAAAPVVEFFKDRTGFERWFEPIEDKPQRWRADLEGGEYFAVEINDYFRAVKGYDWDGDSSRSNYEVGNYFRTREQAEAVAEAIKTLLATVHEETPARPRTIFNGDQRERLTEAAQAARALVQAGDDD